MKTVIVSGYFNPVHIGHLAYFRAAKRLGDELWVIVNNDRQVELKGSVPFMCAADRLRIISEMSVVDRAVMSIDEDRTVCKTVASLWDDQHEFVFANGGDATHDTVPEVVVCEDLGIELAFGVGGQKIAASSELLSKAAV